MVIKSFTVYLKCISVQCMQYSCSNNEVQIEQHGAWLLEVAQHQLVTTRCCFIQTDIFWHTITRAVNTHWIYLMRQEGGTDNYYL